MAKRTKKLEAELFQVKAQLERTSSAKIDEMLSFQKSAFDRTNLGYDFSSSYIASSSTIVFVSRYLLIMLILRTMNVKLI